MSESILEKRPHLIPAIIAALMLLGALGHWPYGYYHLLRFVVCGVSIYIAYTAYNYQKMWAVWLFCFVAVLFNPLTPIALSRKLWQCVDIICAVLFAATAFILRKPSEEKIADRRQRNNIIILSILSILAFGSFFSAIESFRAAKNNQHGGYIPIYAGHSEGREWVDDEWVDVTQYTQYLKGRGKEDIFWGCVFTGLFCYVARTKRTIQENK